MKQSIYQFYRRALLCYPGFVILFYIVSVPVWLYLAILDTVLLLTCLLYINSDAEFFSTVTQDSFWGNLAFLTAKFLHHRSLRWFSDQELWFATILLVLEFFVLSLSLSPLGEKPEFPPIEMFKEQRQDVDRLRRYIMDLPLMGINAKWGNGKSLIWAKLKEDPVIQENFEIIQIDLLACNLDSVELILLDQLEHILEQHGIYPKSSRHLKALLGQNKWTNWIGSVLGLDKSSLSASFDSLQKDLYCMSKKVLIGFEDIDRISDKDSIKKIFAISEKLASEQVHIVFQYNEDLLADVGLDHQYLEKYIPHTVTLTEMSYVGLVFDLWRVLEMRSCPINVLELVDMDFPDYAEKSANQLLGQYSTSRFTSYYWNPSIRSVRAYLLDLKELTKSNPTLFTEQNRKITIRILFVKHFFRDVYDKFRIGKNVMDEDYLVYPNTTKKRVSFSELLSDYNLKISNLDTSNLDAKNKKKEKHTQQKQLRAFFETTENYNFLSVLLLLGYKIECADVLYSYNHTDEVIRALEKNEKIDHLIWKVIANGTAELTEAEDFVSYVKTNVLDRPQRRWQSAWKNMNHELYDPRIPVDFEIAKGCDAKFCFIFKEAYVTGQIQELQIPLLRFYFHTRKLEDCNDINYSLLSCLNYCDLTQEAAFLLVAGLFGRSTAKTNPADLKVYWNFFNKMMQEIEKLEIGDVEITHSDKAVLQSLQQYEQKLVACMKALPDTAVKYGPIRSFIRKNIELMQLSEVMEVDPGIRDL